MVTTFRLNGMIMWIVFGALCFSAIYVAVGASDLIKSSLLMLPLGRWGVIIVMQLTFFFLGCVLDDFTILVICIPLYVPIITDLGFDPLWFGILYMVNMQMAYLTPPFGWNLFYMRSIVPEGITMGDIYRSVVPFVILQGIGLIIIMVFPQIVLWFSNLVFGR